MRNNKVILAATALLAIVSVSLLTMPKVSAFEVRKDRNLEQNEVVKGDLFTSGDAVQVKGTVNGNLFVAGGSVVVTGKVTGNVFAAGSTISISGDVGRNVYAAGNTIDIEGNVARDIMAGGNQVTVGGIVRESLFAGANTLMVKNDIGENLYAGGSQVTVLKTVGKDAFVGTSSTNLTKEQVKGTLTLKLEDKTKIAAEVEKEKELSKKVFAGFTAFGAVFAVALFLGKYIVSLITWSLFPKFSTRVSDDIMDNFWKNLGIGLLVSFALPIAFIILAVTLIGLPLAFALLVTIGALFFLAQTWTGKAVGEYLFKMLKFDAGMPLQLFVGQLVIVLLSLIPFLGFFVVLVTRSVAVGAVVGMKRE